MKCRLAVGARLSTIFSVDLHNFFVDLHNFFVDRPDSRGPWAAGGRGYFFGRRNPYFCIR